MRILVIVGLPIRSARMDVDTITGPALESGADTIAVGLLDGETDALDALGLRALAATAARPSPTSATSRSDTPARRG